jgi:hypothetical protein
MNDGGQEIIKVQCEAVVVAAEAAIDVTLISIEEEIGTDPITGKIIPDKVDMEVPHHLVQVNNVRTIIAINK